MSPHPGNVIEHPVPRAGIAFENAAVILEHGIVREACLECQRLGRASVAKSLDQLVDVLGSAKATPRGLHHRNEKLSDRVSDGTRSLNLEKTVIRVTIASGSLLAVFLDWEAGTAD